MEITLYLAQSHQQAVVAVEKMITALQVAQAVVVLILAVEVTLAVLLLLAVKVLLVEVAHQLLHNIHLAVEVVLPKQEILMEQVLVEMAEPYLLLVHR
jgi:hypothetical protein